jgi:hypothetical protein
MMGMLAGFIGGAAKAGQGILQSEREREGRMADRKVELDYVAELEQRKTRALEMLKAEMAEAQAQKDIKTVTAAQEKVEPSLIEREKQRFARDLGVDALSPEQESAFRDYYYDKEVGPSDDANAKRYDIEASDRSSQMVTELQKSGASSGLLKTAMDQDKVVRAEEKDLRAEQYKRWQEGQRAAADKEDAERTHKQRLAEIDARNRAGGSGSSESKLTPRQQSDAKALDEDIKAARKALEDASADLSSSQSTKRKAAEAATAKAEARLAEAQRQRNEFWDRVEGKRPVTPENKPAPKMDALPKGAVQIGTSGGKPVFRLPDGTKVIREK